MAKVNAAVIDELIERVEKATAPDNALDIAIDIALFKPDREHVAVQANAAGTKLVYTRRDGLTDTYWAQDYTLSAARRSAASALLRALKQQEERQ